MPFERFSGRTDARFRIPRVFDILFCEACDKALTPQEAFLRRNGKTYCRRCYDELDALYPKES